MTMDPVTTSVVTGVIANGITSVIAALARPVAALRGRQEAARRVVDTDAELVRLVSRALSDFSGRVSSYDVAALGRLRSFLLGADAAQIIRDLYVVGLGGDSDAASTLRATFVALYADLVLPGDEAMANQLFDALAEASTRAIAAAIEQGILPASEMRDDARHRTLFSELQQINRTLRLLTAAGTVDSFNKFDMSYREQASHRFGLLDLHHLDAPRRVPLDSVYVPPPFRRASEPHKLIELSDLLAGVYRLVVLGNPGGGKSTLAAKLCFSASKEYESAPVGGRRLTPALVVLRNYGAWRQHQGQASIVKFIEDACVLQVPVVPGAIEYLLSAGRMLVVFDGLDELIDTSLRREIRDDVESFSTMYPGVSVVVTSREVGYEQAPLDAATFDAVNITDFREEEIGQYVSKWFALDQSLEPKQQEEYSVGFLRDSALVADLRRNPLMLALMCNIYRGEKYIPRNRPDVYEKCATLLFDKWDQSRGISVKIPFENQVGPAIRHIAYWIYRDPQLQLGVTEAALIKSTTDFLTTRQFEERADAEYAAKEFVAYIHGRAWVFSDTGSTAAGEHLYQFTHRTFLEYFAASCLVRTNATPEKLLAILAPRIAEREWDVVAQLAFQIQSKQVDGAADELLDGLLSSVPASCEAPAHVNVLSFAARSMSFLVPSPRTVREITKRVVEYGLSGRIVPATRSRARAAIHDRAVASAAEMLGGLADAASDNVKVVTKTLVDIVLPACLDPSPKIARCGLEIGLHLDYARHWLGGDTLHRESSAVLDLRRAVVESVEVVSRRRVLSRTELAVAIDCYLEGLLEVDDLLAFHGANAIFKHPSYRIVGALVFVPLGIRVLLGVVSNETRGWYAYGPRAEAALASFGRHLFGTLPPWCDLSDEGYVRYLLQEALTSETNEKLGEEAQWGFLLTWLTFSEVVSEVGGYPSGDALDPQNPTSLARMAHRLVLARRQRDTVPRSEDADNELLKPLGLTSPKADLVRKWVREEISFTKKPARRRASSAQGSSG